MSKQKDGEIFTGKKLSKKELDSLVNWIPEGWYGLNEASNLDHPFYSDYRHPIIELLNDCQVFVNQKNKDDWKSLDKWNGLDFEVLPSSTGGEYDGCHWNYRVVRFGEYFILFNYINNSWGEQEFEDITYKQVFPVKKLVEVTEWKSM